MARIRSIHPGLWTDEAFVSLGPFARLMFLGLLNECDDMGSFEWAPLKLKMRLLPADSVDAAALLAELQTCGQVMGYEVGGKRYGAVRNFCQYQRPKKPTSVYPQPEAVGKWVNTAARLNRDGGEATPASKASSGELPPRSTKLDGAAVGKQLPTGGEKSRQRKEEGGRRETTSDKPDVVGAPSRASRSGASLSVPDWVPSEPWAAFVEMRKAMPKVPFTDRAAKGVIKELEGFAAAGHDLSAILMKSVMNGYRGVWAPDHPPAQRPAEAVKDEVAAISHATAERYRREALPGPPPEMMDQLFGPIGGRRV